MGTMCSLRPCTDANVLALRADVDRKIASLQQEVAKLATDERIAALDAQMAVLRGALRTESSKVEETQRKSNLFVEEMGLLVHAKAKLVDLTESRMQEVAAHMEELVAGLKGKARPPPPSDVSYRQSCRAQDTGVLMFVPQFHNKAAVSPTHKRDSWVIRVSATENNLRDPASVITTFDGTCYVSVPVQRSQAFIISYVPSANGSDSPPPGRLIFVPFE